MPATITVHVVLCEEVNPPAGEDAISWMLVTTLPIETDEDVRRIIAAYCVRWQIEVFFRTLKSGCRIERRGLRQLTGTPSDPMFGVEGRRTALIEDFDPCYLPDGGIAFVSTRPQTHIRCHYGGRYFANFLLYRADRDGANIRQLSFAEAPEWKPSVLDDGRIVFARWDYTNRHSYHFQCPWVIRPDGTGTANLYGNMTRNPIHTGEPRQVPGSHKIVSTAMAHHGYTAGSIVLVDPRVGLDGLAPLTRITPEVAFPESEGWPVGAFATPFPLSEDLFLAAYTPEQLAREGQVQSVAAYGIYLVDRFGGRELIYRDPAMSCFSPIPIRPRRRPPVLPPAVKDEQETATGVFVAQNVYQSTQPIDAGSVKSLRVMRVFPQTVETPPSRSITPYEMPRQIVGTVPVADDGSVAFRAPAGQPLQFQLLDEHGMALMTMRALVYLQPGETAGCVGCHEPRNVAPAPFGLLSGREIHDLQPPSGPRYEGGLCFARTVRPGLVKVAHADLETDYSTPKDYFAHAGRLAPLLLAGHPDEDGAPRVRLDDESFARIVDWLDANAVCYGDYSWNKPGWRGTRPEGERALRTAIRDRFGPALAERPLAALVNVALPRESWILNAPLAAEAGGWGLLRENKWRDTSDPSYQHLRQLVEASPAPAPYRDIAGTCGRDEQCVCDNCWVRLLADP